jgi:phage baseplate assembly protein W
MADNSVRVPASFLGKGWKYPFMFTQRTGGVYKGTSVSATDEVRHIEESINQILHTPIGSRVIRRDFGSLLHSIVFDPNDVTLDVQFEYMVRKALETWEPRVIVGPVSVDRTFWKEGQVELGITFRIIRTNVVRNMVFPYFLSVSQRKTWVTPASGA